MLTFGAGSARTKKVEKKRRPERVMSYVVKELLSSSSLRVGDAERRGWLTGCWISCIAAVLWNFEPSSPGLYVHFLRYFSAEAFQVWDIRDTERYFSDVETWNEVCP